MSTDAIGHLSYRAVKYGAQLRGVTDAESLTRRLYRYNMIPCAPRRRRQLQKCRLEDFVGDSAAEAEICLRDASWESSIVDGWTYFQNPRPRVFQPSPYKLYVSPLAVDLGKALKGVAAELTHSEAHSFKFPFAATGAYRSDKLIVYFAELGALQATAGSLALSLRGLAAQPTPFTCGITTDGLLSWALDPPMSDSDSTSWRMWICQRLARALIRARTESGNDGSWKQALLDLWADSVELPSWAPKDLRPADVSA